MHRVVAIPWAGSIVDADVTSSPNYLVARIFGAVGCSRLRARNHSY